LAIFSAEKFLSSYGRLIFIFVMQGILRQVQWWWKLCDFRKWWY